MSDFEENLVASARKAHQDRGPREIHRHDPRPHVRRIFSFGRGDPRCVWIDGRTVRTLAEERKVPDMDFETFLRDGYPPDVVAILGEETVASVTDAVRQLAPLSCMCGSGADTPEQHGTIVTLASGQNPDAPIDDRITIGVCSVCGQTWRFRETGDTHYSYHYQCEPIDLTSPRIQSSMR